MQYRTVSFLPRLRDSFWRYKWLFLLSVLTVSVITVGALVLRKPMYSASASVQVITDQDDTAAMLGLQERMSWITPSQQNVNHLNDLLNDDRPDGFLDSALKHANLKHPLNIDPRSNDKRAAMLRKGLFVMTDSSSLFSIVLTWDDREECEQILTALMQQYIEEVGNDRQARSIQTTNFLDSQINRLRASMETAENSLISYKKNNAGTTPDAQQADQQQMAALKIQRDQLLIQVQENASKTTAVKDQLKNLPIMTVSSYTIAASPEQQAVRDLISKRTQLLVNGYQRTSESVRNINEQIENLEKQILANQNRVNKGRDITSTVQQSNPQYEQLMGQLNDLEIASNGQEAQLRSLDAQIGTYAARIEKFPAAQRDLTNRTRDYKSISAEYDRLVEERDKARMKSELERITATASLVPVGTIYAEKSTSKGKQMIMMVGGIILGLIVGVAVVVLSEWCDTTLRYGADAERILDINVLAEVPDLKALPVPARVAALPGASGTST